MDLGRHGAPGAAFALLLGGSWAAFGRLLGHQGRYWHHLGFQVGAQEAPKIKDNSMQKSLEILMPLGPPFFPDLGPCLVPK